MDLRIQQASDYPTINIDVDRTKAGLLGLTQQNIASNMLVSLSGSFQTSPSFWIDPKNGTQYNVATQAPQYRMQSLNDLATTPLDTGTAGGKTAVLSDVASFGRSVSPANVSHYDATPALDIYGSVEGTDLGYVSTQVARSSMTRARNCRAAPRSCCAARRRP